MKQLNVIIYIALILLAPSVLSAGIAEDRIFDRLGSQHGIPQVEIYAMHQDSRGYIWLGTLSGAIRYNGASSRTFGTEEGLGHNVIYSIAEDSQGNIYLGTYGGGVDIITPDYQISPFKRFQDFESNKVNDLLIDSHDNLWVTTENGIYLISETSTQKIAVTSSQNTIKATAIIENSDGQVMVATSDGIYIYNARNQVFDIWRESIRGQWIYTISEGSAGKIYFGNATSVYLIEKDADVATRIGPAESMHVFSILEESLDNLWFGTGEGLYRKTSEGIEKFLYSSQKEWEFVGSIMRDHSDQLWFATENGVMRTVNKVFKNYGINDSLPGNGVLDIVEAGKDHFYLATTKGIYQLKNGLISALLGKEQLLDEYIMSLELDDENRLYFLSSSGFGYWDGNKVTNLGNIARPSDFKFDNYGNLIITTEVGVMSWDGEILAKFSQVPALDGAYVFCVEIDKQNNYWFSTNSRGLIRWDGERTVIYDASNGLTDQTLWTVSTDYQGGVWVGSNGDGVYHVSDSGISRISGKDGLSGNFIWQVIEDNEGNIWVNTSKGLDRVSSGEVTNFSVAHGLVANEGYVNAAFVDSQNRIWSCSPEGISYADLDSIHSSEAKPMINIENVTIFGSSLPLGDSVLLDPGQHSPQIHFQGISYGNENRIIYRNRISNRSEEWSEANNLNSVFISQLKPCRLVIERFKYYLQACRLAP